jgi:transposase-like protein
MADERMGLLESVRQAIADGDVLREGVRLLAEGLMEPEVTERTEVPHGERDPEPRSGHAGGSAFPSLLEPRRLSRAGAPRGRPWRPTCSASRRACVEDLVDALGIASRSTREVSRIGTRLGAEVDAFRHRPLLGEPYPYRCLDATDVTVRDAGRVVSMAWLLAIGLAPAPGRARCWAAGPCRPPRARPRLPAARRGRHRHLAGGVARTRP